MSRLLIADDLIPDSKLSSDKEVYDHYSTVFKDDPHVRELADWFVFFRRLVLLFRERGCDVDTANTPASALDLAKRHTYDAIVLDLGWYTVEHMPYDDKMLLGFSIADQMRQHCSAPILMFSNRFVERNELATTAAEKGLLPIYKSHDQSCIYHLLVTINWLTNRRTLAERMRDERKVYDLRMYRRLSEILLASIAFSVILLGITSITVLMKYADVQLVSSLFGIVSTALSGIIYKYVVEYRKSID
jgi:hypothetical protein